MFFKGFFYTDIIGGQLYSSRKKLKKQGEKNCTGTSWKVIGLQDKWFFKMYKKNVLTWVFFSWIWLVRVYKRIIWLEFYTLISLWRLGKLYLKAPI